MKSIRNPLLALAVSLMTLALSHQASATVLTAVNINDTGSAQYDSTSGLYTLTSTGGSSLSSSDYMTFDYTAISGNFTVSTVVQSMEVSNTIDAAGLMATNGLDPSAVNAASAYMNMSSSTGGSSFYRTSAGVGNEGNPCAPCVSGSAPFTVTLSRSGNTFTESANGTVMTQQTIAMSNTIDVGLFLDGWEGASTTATFSNLQGFPTTSQASGGAGTPTSVPEPKEAALLLLALAAVGGLRRKT